ncbi:MAG: hypothetical protein Q4D73_00080 [Actinomycetaceae bacterium]|nr:hypothetical protein [Actinomycetaceae bacterium]
MAIYLAINQQETETQVSSRLHLYNLAPQPWTDTTQADSSDLLITDQQMAVGSASPRILRLGVDLQIPGDEDLLFCLSTELSTTASLTAKSTGKPTYPLLILVGATGKSGVTRLVTHPRLLPLKKLRTAANKTQLIRVNLIEDPSFTQRLQTPYTLVTWQGEATAADFIPQRLPAGEVVIDADFFNQAPSEKTAQILQHLANWAPVIVDAGRLTVTNLHLAQNSGGQLLLVCPVQWKSGIRGLWRRLTTGIQARRSYANAQQLQEKWQLPLVSNWQELHQRLEQTHVAQ